MVTHLATEGAGVLGVLADLNLFHHLPERGTITGTVFTNNSHLLGALGLQTKKKSKEIGKLKQIACLFTFNQLDSSNIRCKS